MDKSAILFDGKWICVRKLLAYFLPEESKSRIECLALRNGICRYCCLTERCGRILPPGVTCRKTCTVGVSSKKGKGRHCAHRFKKNVFFEQAKVNTQCWRDLHSRNAIPASPCQAHVDCFEAGWKLHWSVARHVHMYGKKFSAATYVNVLLCPR